MTEQGCCRSPITPGMSCSGNTLLKDVRSITAIKRWTVQSQQAGHDRPAPLASSKGTCCPLLQTDIVLWLQACTRSEARLCPPRLCLQNNRNQKPQQTPSSSLARDHVTGQEGRRHFDQSGIALNRFHTDISATGINPQHSKCPIPKDTSWHAHQGPSKPVTGGCSQGKVMAESSLEKGREPPCALSEEIKAQRGSASPVCLQHRCVLGVLKTAARNAPLQLPSTCPWDLLPHVCPFCSLLRVNDGYAQDGYDHPAGRGLMMPRELQEASSLPSLEQWGHCGRPGRASVGRSQDWQLPNWAPCSCQVLSLPSQV